MNVRAVAGPVEPHWTGLGQLRGMPPPEVVAWLRDPGSLTGAVIRACDGHFQVHVRGQYWGRPWPSERRLLGMPGAQRALLREVELMCDERPWVFARTLIPVGSLRGRARRLARLRNRPLGAVLFSGPAIQRDVLQVACLTPRHALYHAACAHLERPPAELWGRRTLFRYAGHPILVNEIFLPGMPPWRAGRGAGLLGRPR